MTSSSSTPENLWPFPLKGESDTDQTFENFEDTEELEEDDDDCLDLKEIEDFQRNIDTAEDFPELTDSKMPVSAKLGKSNK